MYFKVPKKPSGNAAMKKTMKRTRKFVIDGVVVTTTTSKVIYGDEDQQRYDQVLRLVFFHLTILCNKM